jgi:hypothetical protein
MFALPATFALARGQRVGFRRRQTHGLNRVGSRAQFMVCHVRGRDSMACRAGNRSGGRVRCAAGRGMGRQGRLPRRASGGFAARSGPRRRDRPARAVVLRIPGKEQRKDMLGAVRRPARQKTVSPLIKQAAAVEGDETWIPTPRVPPPRPKTPSVLPNDHGPQQRGLQGLRNSESRYASVVC